MGKKHFVVLGLSDLTEGCKHYLEECGLTVESVLFIDEAIHIFDKPIDDVTGIIMFRTFAVHGTEHTITKGKMAKEDRKKIRLICEEQGLPFLRINSFTGNNADKGQIKKWLRHQVFKK